MEQERIDLTQFAERIEELRGQISQVIVGQTENIDLLLTAVLANGHVLLEGVPGVAKTLLARLLAKLIDAKFSRVQFTPDLMPSDVLGTNVFNMKTSDFDFHAGPVFADIVLVDEINRAPAKTQAALFEVMEERQVTIDGKTHPMGQFYTILATQNPVEQEGTYKLPEAQTDRFMMKITMGYPTLDEEVSILERHHANQRLTSLDDIQPVLTKDELIELRQHAQRGVCRSRHAALYCWHRDADTPEQGGIPRGLAPCVGGHAAGLEGLRPAAGTRLRHTRRRAPGGSQHPAAPAHPHRRGRDGGHHARQRLSSD